MKGNSISVFDDVNAGARVPYAYHLDIPSFRVLRKKKRIPFSFSGNAGAYRCRLSRFIQPKFLSPAATVTRYTTSSNAGIQKSRHPRHAFSETPRPAKHYAVSAAHQYLSAIPQHCHASLSLLFGINLRAEGCYSVDSEKRTTAREKKYEKISTHEQP